MKIQLDTINKTIKIEEQVNLDEFIKTIKELLPNDKWKKFKIEVQQFSYPYVPIINEPCPSFPQPFRDYPLITYIK